MYNPLVTDIAQDNIIIRTLIVTDDEERTVLREVGTFQKGKEGQKQADNWVKNKIDNFMEERKLCT